MEAYPQDIEPDELLREACAILRRRRQGRPRHIVAAMGGVGTGGRDSAPMLAWENGKRFPSMRSFLRWCRGLNVCPWEILREAQIEIEKTRA